MFLAAALDEYPVETRADLQRVYCIDIGRLGDGVSALHVAACLSCLMPGDSLLLARLEEKTDDSGLPSTQSVSADEYEVWRRKNWGEVETWQTGA